MYDVNELYATIKKCLPYANPFYDVTIIRNNVVVSDAGWTCLVYHTGDHYEYLTSEMTSACPIIEDELDYKIISIMWKHIIEVMQKKHESEVKDLVDRVMIWQEKLTDAIDYQERLEYQLSEKKAECKEYIRYLDQSDRWTDFDYSR